MTRLFTRKEQSLSDTEYIEFLKTGMTPTERYYLTKSIKARGIVDPTVVEILSQASDATASYDVITDRIGLESYLFKRHRSVTLSYLAHELSHKNFAHMSEDYRVKLLLLAKEIGGLYFDLILPFLVEEPVYIALMHPSHTAYVSYVMRNEDRGYKFHDFQDYQIIDNDPLLGEQKLELRCDNLCLLDEFIAYALQHYYFSAIRKGEIRLSRKVETIFDSLQGNALPLGMPDIEDFYTQMSQHTSFMHVLREAGFFNLDRMFDKELEKLLQ